MKKVIFGTGLMICGTLGVLTHTLVMGLYRIMSYRWGIMYLLRPTLMNYGAVIFFAGVILSVWGLIEQDKNEMKMTVFGTGLIICGVLLEYGYAILWGILVAYQVEFTIPEYRFFAYTFIFARVVFNIWGLIRRRKEDDLVS